MDYYDNFIINSCSKLKGRDCSQIINSLDYLKFKKVLMKYFKNNFIVNQEFNHISSNVYKIGDYILKISIIHKPTYIPKTSSLVKIYYRNNFYFMDDSISLGLEIQDYIEEKPMISDYSKMFSLYKSLREIGYIWTDASYENIGILNDKYVIIDSDYIYKENDANYDNISFLSQKLEADYQKTI